MEQAVTDAILEQLGKQKVLEKVNVNFCKQITAAGLEFLADHEL